MKTSSTKSGTTASKSATASKAKTTSEPVQKKSATTATKAVEAKQVESHKSVEIANAPTEKTTKTNNPQSETSSARFEQSVISRERIAEKAFELWLQRGCTHGHDVEDWLLAEQQIKTV